MDMQNAHVEMCGYYIYMYLHAHSMPIFDRLQAGVLSARCGGGFLSVEIGTRHILRFSLYTSIALAVLTNV